VFIAVRRRRNLVYAKDTFSIHTRKQCMLQHTQHIGLRRLCMLLQCIPINFFSLAVCRLVMF